MNALIHGFDPDPAFATLATLDRAEPRAVGSIFSEEPRRSRPSSHPRSTSDFRRDTQSSEPLGDCPGQWRSVVTMYCAWASTKAEECALSPRDHTRKISLLFWRRFGTVCVGRTCSRYPAFPTLSDVAVRQALRLLVYQEIPCNNSGRVDD
jgi:hypothetical protein